MPTAIRFVTRIQDADDFADLNAIQFVSMAASGFVTNERVLTGTANQVIVTDGGAGGAATLSTPQDIHAGATPQFAGLGIGVAGVAGGIAMADDSWIGISAADERIIFDAAGDISFAGCNVGIEDAAPGAKLDIDIDAAGTIGCIIQGAAGQTANLQEWQDSGGNIRALVTPTGQLGVGQWAVPTAMQLAYFYWNKNDATQVGVYTLHNIRGDFTNPANQTTGQLRALVTEMRALGTRDYNVVTGGMFIGSNYSTGSISWLTGGLFEAYPAKGNVTSAIGGQFGVTLFDQNITVDDAYCGFFRLTQSVASTITDGYGVYISAPSKTAGTLTNLYGLYVGDQSVGATLNYAIYTNAGLVRLGDNTEIEEVETLTGDVADDYAAGLALDPGYTGAFTVTRHNYIDVQDVSLAAGAAVTDAAVFRFDAAIGTHKALPAAFQTTDSGGDTTNWAGGILINILGTLYKIPFVAA